MKYATSLDKHILPALGRHYVDRLKSDHVRAYVAMRTDDGAAGNTVLNELRLLRTIAKDSQADGYALRYWCERVSPPAVREYDEDDPNLLDAEQIGKLIATIPKKWRTVVELMMYTGLRWGEASALRYEDIHDGFARISRTNWKGREQEAKTKKSKRVVPLPFDLGSGTGYIFPTRRGTLHKGTPLKKVLDKACIAAKVPRVTSQGLRRSFNNLGRQVAAKEVIKAITGHVTDAMFDHYSVVGRDEKRAAQGKVIDMVRAAGKKAMN